MSDMLNQINNTATRALEIRQATTAFPGMEIGAAYKKWKEGRGESAVMLNSAKQETLKKETQALYEQLHERPCTREGCDGTQHLEGVCGGCIEGQAGYKTKWTCKTCLHRDLSKEGLQEWMLKLSSG